VAEVPGGRVTDLEKVEKALRECEANAQKPTMLAVWARSRREAMAWILRVADESSTEAP
jgi:hypothetical protein